MGHSQQEENLEICKQDRTNENQIPDPIVPFIYGIVIVLITGLMVFLKWFY